jgi:hypothetical protein
MISLTLVACSRPQSIIIDDVLRTKTELDNLDSTEIFSYSKWEPGKAPPWYHKWNNTVLIVIKTKEVEIPLQKQRHALLNRLLDSVDNGKDILIVEDGIIINPGAHKRLRLLSYDQLSAVDTLELGAAKELYGSLARMVSLIITRYDPDTITNHSR